MVQTSQNCYISNLLCIISKHAKKKITIYHLNNLKWAETHLKMIEYCQHYNNHVPLILMSITVKKSGMPLMTLYDNQMTLKQVITI